MLLTCAWVKGFCCAQAGRAKTSSIASMKKVTLLQNRIATSLGCWGLKGIWIIPKIGE